MKVKLICIFIVTIFSCEQRIQENDCNKVISESFKGAAAIFFHKPISGSTYQVFLFPVCKLHSGFSGENSVVEKNVGKGISFTLTSDDTQFKTIRNRAIKVRLADTSQIAENFKSIYYCLAKVDVSIHKDDTNSVMNSKKLILESGSVVLKYLFVSKANLIVNSILGD